WSSYVCSSDLAEYVYPKDAGIIVEKDPLGAKLLPESNNKIYELRKREGISIIPGFFGYTYTGELATFSRGGSDITGAIIAAGVVSDLYEKFIDVDSVFAVFPTIMEQLKEIKILNYHDMNK